MTDEAPKSAVELTMERLRKQDADAGVHEEPLTGQQRDAIAEIRRMHQAGVAERLIMHDSFVLAAANPAERARHQAELRRDLDRFERETDERIKKIREGTET
jgi:hypothetical protein